MKLIQECECCGRKALIGRLREVTVDASTSETCIFNQRVCGLCDMQGCKDAGPYCATRAHGLLAGAPLWGRLAYWFAR